MIKLIRYIGFMVMIGILSLPLTFAQDKQTEINKIKKDQNFLTATGTSLVSKEAALAKAQEKMNTLLSQWLANNADGDITDYMTRSKEHISKILTEQGNLFRCFVYVNKKDILSYYKGDSMIGDLPKQTATPVQGVLNNSNASSNSSSIVTASPGLAPKSKSHGEITHNDEERSMLDILSVSALSNYLKQLHRQGKLADFNESTAWPQEQTVYLFVADYNEVIRKRVKVTYGSAYNLKDGSPVDTDNLLVNYETGTYYWFILK